MPRQVTLHVRPDGNVRRASNIAPFIRNALRGTMHRATLAKLHGEQPAHLFEPVDRKSNVCAVCKAILAFCRSFSRVALCKCCNAPCCAEPDKSALPENRARRYAHKRNGTDSARGNRGRKLS